MAAAAAIVLTDASYGWKLPSRDDPLDVEGEGKGTAEGVSLVVDDAGLRLLACDGRRASMVQLPGLRCAVTVLP